MASIKSMANCLWFDGQAEDAAKYYVSIFPNSRITQITHYGKAGQDEHQKEPGSVLTVSFELDGSRFVGLNGGPNFKFNEAISFEIGCDTQQDIDYFWNKLTAGGDPAAQVCGWLKDKYGVSWQVVPTIMYQMLEGSPTPASERVMAAMMKMKKLDLATLEQAFAGGEAPKESKAKAHAGTR
jgi:predicted 3-demethylubiquinone-9 3-methyltransferase (glyoxalase superfamily)